MILPKPLFKYPGGKRRLIEAEPFSSYFQVKVNKYYEPFCGASAAFLKVKTLNPNAKCHLNDINSNLINMYRHLNHPNFLNEIKNLQEEMFAEIFEPPPKKIFGKGSAISPSRKSFFYRKRDEWESRTNRTDFEMAIHHFFYHCNAYQGKVPLPNKKGQTKVTCGNRGSMQYKDIPFFLEENINIWQTMLANTTLTNNHWLISLKDIEDSTDTLVYLDPPYIDTSSLYTCVWTKDDNEQIFNFINKFKKTKFLLSNDNTCGAFDLFINKKEIEYQHKFLRIDHSTLKQRNRKEVLLYWNF